MTLQEWCEKNGEVARLFDKPGYSKMQTVADRTRSRDASWDLYHLEDYVVTSVQAGTVWLAPKRVPVVYQPCGHTGMSDDPAHFRKGATEPLPLPSDPDGAYPGCPECRRFRYITKQELGITGL